MSAVVVGNGVFAQRWNVEKGTTDVLAERRAEGIEVGKALSRRLAEVEEGEISFADGVSFVRGEFGVTTEQAQTLIFRAASQGLIVDRAGSAAITLPRDS
jgi:hypothetical protein